MEGLFGADATDKIDLFWIYECFILVLIILLPNGNSSLAKSSISISPKNCLKRVKLTREEPCSRRYVMIALVSTPVIAGTPLLIHHWLRLSTAVQCEYCSATSATTTPAACRCGLSK